LPCSRDGFQSGHQRIRQPLTPRILVNQKFGDIGAVRLVFRLVGNQLYRTNKPLLRIRCGENNALTGGDALRHSQPERRRGFREKGSIKLTEAPPLTQLTRMSVNSGRCSRISSRDSVRREKDVVIGNSLKLTTSLCF
jgi:hypothetical protein